MTSSGSSLDDPATLGFLYCICTVAVVCNLIVLVVVLWSKRLRASTDVYLANLAISDILLSGVAMPLKLVNASSHDFYGGNPVCKIVMFVPMFTIMSCISTMVAIAFDRYFSIVKQRPTSTKTSITVIVLIWILSILTSSPQLYEYKTYSKLDVAENETETVCGSHGTPENFEMGYAIGVLIISYMIPIIVIASCYGSLVAFLWKRSNSQNFGTTADGLPRQGQISKVKMKILKLMITLTTVFAALWLPYFIMFSIEEITDTDDIDGITFLHAFKTVLVVLSTVSNPVLYALFNGNFRREMVSMATCRSARVAPVENNTSTNEN